MGSKDREQFGRWTSDSSYYSPRLELEDPHTQDLENRREKVEWDVEAHMRGRQRRPRKTNYVSTESNQVSEIHAVKKTKLP